MNGRQWFDAKAQQFSHMPVYMAENLATKIIVRAQEIMEAKGIPQARLAELMGCSPAFVSQTLHGKPNMTILTLCKIASALGVEPEALLTDSDEISPMHCSAGQLAPVVIGYITSSEGATRDPLALVA